MPTQHTDIHSEMQKATRRLKGGGKGLRKNDGGGTAGIKGKEFGIQAKRKERKKRNGGKRRREKERKKTQTVMKSIMGPSSFCAYGLPDFILFYFILMTSSSNTKKQN